MTQNRNLSILADNVSTAGVLNPVGGGTGITSTPANGQIPIGNGTNYTAATITAGTGITVTNGAGSISIATSGSVASVNGFTGTVQSVVVQGTAVASTSGTSITFTGIPSWAKRVTVMFNGVSLSGSAYVLIQIGSGSTSSSGYSSAATGAGSSVVTTSSTSGFIMWDGNAAYAMSGIMTIALISSNTWVSSHSIGTTAGASITGFGGGTSPALGGALDRIIITTTNGTDTFDAGTINFQYE